MLNMAADNFINIFSFISDELFGNETNKNGWFYFLCIDTFILSNYHQVLTGRLWPGINDFESE